ncbi:MAG: two pore domain potassium channel family protein [Flavobacteriales bacterium]|nr:two pore domain potassium channel family protein [Flavobacteriales bacterium]
MLLEQVIKQKHKFFWLFVNCILILLLPPLDPIERLKPHLFLGLFTTLVLLNVYCISTTKKQFYLFGSLGTLTIIIPWIDFTIFGSGHSSPIGLLPFSLFFSFISYKIIMHIFKQSEVNSDTIFGAISGYIMMGITGAIAAYQLHLMVPTAFSLPANSEFSEFLYFSFVTISTLGYGDVLPISSFAKSLSIVLTVFGQFYMAIVVAIIIGKFISKTSV